MAVDKPIVHASLAALRKEVTDPDPYRVALTGSKVITFPDIYAMESVAAEEIFAGLNRNATNWVVLGKWMSKDDCAALKAEKLSLRLLSTVVQAAIAYYETSYGNAGEDTASES